MLTEESMRIVAVSMSPKPFGNTEYLLDRVADGIMETGGTVEKIRTQELEIAPCEGCNGCMRTGRVTEHGADPGAEKRSRMESASA